MTTIAENIEILALNKQQIRAAIIAKGVAVPENTPFKDYPDKIMQIEGGGGEVFNPQYQQDMPEPNWTTLASVLPSACWVTRLPDGRWVHNSGYSGTSAYGKITFRDAALNKIADVQTTKGGNARCIPMYVPGYKGKNVVIFQHYSSNANTEVIIADTDSVGVTYSVENKVVTATYAGAPTDWKSTINEATNWSVYAEGRQLGMFTVGGKLVTTYGTPFLSPAMEDVSWPFPNYALESLGLKLDHGAGGGYSVATQSGNWICVANNLSGYKAYVFLKDIFEQTHDWLAAKYWEFDDSCNNGANAFYVWDNKMVTVDFLGYCNVYDLVNKVKIVTNRQVSTSNTGCYAWHNKLMRTDSKAVVTLW
jgi:hypothetical protein